MPRTGPVIRPASEAVFTMCPSEPCRSITGTNVRTPWITPHRLTPITHSQSSAGTSHSVPLRGTTPALLHTMCTCPKASSVRLASDSTSSGRETSVRTASTVAPPSRISFSAWASAASSTSARTTFIPSRAKRSAIARPIPLAAPVTTATRSLNSFISIPLLRLNDRYRFDFHQHLRLRQCGHLHHCRGRPDVAERLAVRPGRLRQAPDVRHEYPRAHHVRERRTGLRQGFLDIADRLLRLGVHIARPGELPVIAPGHSAGHVHRIAHAHRAREPDNGLVGAPG